MLMEEIPNKKQIYYSLIIIWNLRSKILTSLSASPSSLSSRVSRNMRRESIADTWMKRRRIETLVQMPKMATKVSLTPLLKGTRTIQV